MAQDLIFDTSKYQDTSDRSKARHEANRQRKRDCKHESELAIMEIRDRLFKRINSNKLGVFEVDGRARSIARRYYYSYICNQIAAFSIFIAIATIIFAPFALILSIIGVFAIVLLYVLSPSFYLQFRTPIGHEHGFIKSTILKILFGNFQPTWMLYLSIVWAMCIATLWFMPNKQLIPFSSDLKYIYYVWDFIGKQLKLPFDVGYEFKATVFIVPLLLQFILSTVWLITKGGNMQINLSDEIDGQSSNNANKSKDSTNTTSNKSSIESTSYGLNSSHLSGKSGAHHSGSNSEHLSNTGNSKNSNYASSDFCSNEASGL